MRFYLKTHTFWCVKSFCPHYSERFHWKLIDLKMLLKVAENYEKCMHIIKVWMVEMVENASKWKWWPKTSQAHVFVACAWSWTYVTWGINNFWIDIPVLYITQVLPVNGEYTAAKPVAGTVLVNIGDLMQQWTADKLRSTVSWVDHVRVPKTLTFKTRRSAQPFLWKSVLFAWEWKIIFIS